MLPLDITQNAALQLLSFYRMILIIMITIIHSDHDW